MIELSQIEKVRNSCANEIAKIEQYGQIMAVRTKIFGKQGELTSLLKEVANLPMDQKATFGRRINELKNEIENQFAEKEKSLSQTKTVLDFSLPGHRPTLGHLHPTTAVVQMMNEIFLGMGFSVAQGPEIETDEWNYDRLNLPQNHPARDLQDTLYIKEPDLLLRTHTSSIEAHILAEYKPPYRFVIPGKVYRYENANASNNIMFYQYQGLAIGEGITMANLKATLDTFVKKFWGENTKTRFRCKYYPEVEPGVGVDISCTFCQGAGCTVCKHRGWIEMLGAGMVHPNMLRRVGLDPQKISGFAWGMGLDRIVMTKFGIKDVRSLYNGDIIYK